MTALKTTRNILVLICLVVDHSFAKKSLFKRDTNTCGSPYRVRGLVLGGREFQRGDFPWMVALLKKENFEPPKYRCGGTLISLKHILTGEHTLIIVE